MTTTKTTCQVDTCAFHHPANKCAAGEIMVALDSENAFCDTFVPRDENTQPVSQQDDVRVGHKMNLHMAIDEETLGVNVGTIGALYEGFASNLTPVVACKAEDCSYNKHTVCFAPGIIINGEEADISQATACDTYAPE